MERKMVGKEIHSIEKKGQKMRKKSSEISLMY